MTFTPPHLRTLAAALLLLGTAACQDQPEQPIQPVQPTPEPQVSIQRAPGVLAQQRAPVSPANTAGEAASADAANRQRIDDSVTTSYALAQLQPVGDSEASGIVSFMTGVPEDTGIRVIAEFINLPTGSHGIHIHENGDCSAPDASSAGGHHNPTDEPHADRDAAQRHMGDLGNLEADANNLASLDFHDTKLSFAGPGSIIGKAVIVHATEDDLTTQPDGAAGERIACGIIEARDSRDLVPTEE